MGMHFNPDTNRHYVGFHLPADQLAAVDAARFGLRLSRSAFTRQALAAYLYGLTVDVSDLVSNFEDRSAGTV